MQRNFRLAAFTIGIFLLAIFVSLSAVALTLTGAQSRKNHGTAVNYDLPLNHKAVITGAITVEPRGSGGTRIIIFEFDEVINSVVSASSVDVAGNALGNASPQVSGTSFVAVTLTGIPDARRITVMLNGVNGSLNTSVSLGFLVGDLNNTLSVDAVDLSNVKARAGQAVNASNFKYDVNTSGSINAADIAVVKSRVGTALGTAVPPMISLAGVASAQVGVATALNASASVSGGATITKVEFYEGVTKLGEDTVAPYLLSWTPAIEGPTLLMAKAITSAGAFTTSAVVDVAVAPHAKADAARLLTQATFGASQTEINRVTLMTPTAYLDEQFNTAQTSHLATVSSDPTYPTAPYAAMMPSIWKQYFEAPDQLRQRIVFALSQIMVISMNNNTIGDQACGAAKYLDWLGANAFGNFRNLLKDITLSPAMGEYLDMKGSAKADTVLGTIPSENFARELMQLFSIGTVMLNIDGSVQFDAMTGKPINTYSEATAQEVARALTGWNFAGQDQTNPYAWLYPDVPYPSDAASAAKACTAWSTPMQPWLTTYRSTDGGRRAITGGAHDTGTKTLLTYPGSTTFSQNVPAGQTPMQDIDAVVDNIFNHPNIGPFIGEQLIMRLVTSNPSGAYVTRVANIFNNNGSGVRGDMKAVIRAILLDAEARAPRSTQPTSYGKLREPILRFTHMHRAFDAKMAGGDYHSIYELSSSDALGQSPLHAPSVFNFYHPDYSPSGPLAMAQLEGPEFEITNSATISGFMDFSQYGIIGGFQRSATDPRLLPVYDSYIALANTPAAMIDAMSVTLLSAGISAQFRTQLIDMVTKLTDSNATTQATERFKTALWLIMNSPEYSIQK